jgi:CRAL/TRIO domain
VWSWIKRWFDPITVSKIFILSSSNMKSVLETYIEPDNIPKKYGGNLDFEFGNMPSLEPAIADSMELLDSQLVQTAKEGGVRSIPTGPIKWRETTGKEMEAVAVGSEKGKPRDRPIARVHTDHQGMYGVDRHENTPIDWALEKVVSTPGTATQGIEEGDLYFGADLASGSTTPDPALLNKMNANGNGTTPASSNVDQTSDPSPTSSSEMAPPVSNDSTSAPAEPHPKDEGQSVSSSQPRTGTSDTRAAASDVTHASGQPHVEENTPHVVDYGHDEKTTTIEPNTVGQAPKDPFVNIPDPEEPPQPGIVDRTKEVAGQAYSTAAGAANTVVSTVTGVVSGGKSEVEEEKEPEPEPKPVKHDGVDKADDGAVEEFLRSQNSSKSGITKSAAK